MDALFLPLSRCSLVSDVNAPLFSLSLFFEIFLFLVAFVRLNGMVKPSLIFLARAVLWPQSSPAHVRAMCWHFAHYRTLIDLSRTADRVLRVAFDEAHLLDSFARRHVHFQGLSVTFCITCGGPAIPPLIPLPPLFSFLPPFLLFFSIFIIIIIFLFRSFVRSFVRSHWNILLPSNSRPSRPTFLRFEKFNSTYFNGTHP